MCGQHNLQSSQFSLLLNLPIYKVNLLKRHRCTRLLHRHHHSTTMFLTQNHKSLISIWITFLHAFSQPRWTRTRPFSLTLHSSHPTHISSSFASFTTVYVHTSIVFHLHSIQTLNPSDHKPPPHPTPHVQYMKLWNLRVRPPHATTFTDSGLLNADGSRVSIAIIRVCDYVCLSVRMIKAKRLKLKSPNSADG